MMCLTRRPRVTIGVPFLCLFMVGYLYVPLTTWFGHRLGKAEADAYSELAAASSVFGTGTRSKSFQCETRGVVGRLAGARSRDRIFSSTFRRSVGDQPISMCRTIPSRSTRISVGNAVTRIVPRKSLAFSVG